MVSRFTGTASPTFSCNERQCMLIPSSDFYFALNKIMRDHLLSPTRRSLENGYVRLTWHVDDDDSRYVEASFALYDPVVVDVLYNDQSCGKSEQHHVHLVLGGDLDRGLDAVLSKIYELEIQLATSSVQPGVRQEASEMQRSRHPGWRLFRG